MSPRSLVVLLLLASPALAERGVFAASLQSGQVVAVAPGLERNLPLLGTLEYGFSERGSLAFTAGVEFSREGVSLLAALEPRFTLWRTHWWTGEVLVAPELTWLPVARRWQAGGRTGVALRYQLMWGFGLSLEAGLRVRADAVGPLVPSFQGYLVGGLFMEA